MIRIEKARRGTYCIFDCGNKASTSINGYNFCNSCSDGELLKIIKECVSAVKNADVTLRVLPKRTKNGKKVI